MDVNPYRLEYVNETKEKFGVEVSEAEKAAVREAFEKYSGTAGKASLSWGQWLWSWFGYSQHKAEEVKREGAAKVAEGARKVESEAGKRT